MLEQFLRNLIDTGRVRVGPSASDWAKESSDVEAVLREVDQARRQDLAGVGPDLRVSVAAWGVEVLYSACRALAYRDMERPEVVRSLGRPCPEAVSPAVCYSADLALSYLPDVVALARGLAEGDPLVDELLGLCRRWPLSSVGVSGVGAVDASAFIGDTSLRTLYVDRIIERGDASRVTVGEVRDGVRAVLGAYPELAPAAVRRAVTEEEIA